MSSRLVSHIRRPSPSMIVALAAVILAAGGVTYAAIPGSDGVIQGCYAKTTGGLRVVDTEKSPPESCKSSEAPLSWNQVGPKGDTGAQGPPGANGATNVSMRFSGQGTAAPGSPPSGENGGAGGNATCFETGCVIARGGNGGDGGAAGTGGTGGSAACGPNCGEVTGGTGGSVGGGPDPGEGGTVGLRASCLAGERAVGGGVRASSRDALTYRSHAATGTSTDPSAGDTPTAWYVETYNQSRAGEGRTGVNVTVRAYVICAAS